MTAETTRSPRGLSRLVLDNPVVLKELRGRMRGARAFTVLTIYLGLLGGFSSLIYMAVIEGNDPGRSMVSGEIGRMLLGGIVTIELMLVSFVAPLFTSGAISGEREHQTYDLLRTTLLPAYSLVLGKLLSAILYVLLLLLAAIPLQSIAFFFGGVAETEVFLSFVILSVTALLFSTIGIYFSARTHRTLIASVLTYSTMIFIIFGVPILVGLILFITAPRFSTLSSPMAYLVVYGAVLLLSTNPVATAYATQYLLLTQQTIGTFRYTMANGETITLLSPWISFTVLYLILTSVFYFFSVRRVNRIEG